MDHDRLLLGLIALSTLAKIKLSIGLILPGLESFSNYNIGMWPLAYYHSFSQLWIWIRSSETLPLLRHNVSIPLARVMQRMKDEGFAFTSTLGQVDLQSTCITMCNTFKPKFSSSYSQ